MHTYNEVPAWRYVGPITAAIDANGNRSWSKQHDMVDVERYHRMQECVKELMTKKPTPEEPKWTKQAAWRFVFRTEFGKDPIGNQTKPT